MTKATLLVIDDDASVRESMAGYLEDSGYHVLQAADGEQGLTLYKDSRPDLILCDLRMPRKDGLEVLQDVVETGRLTPFIVISGAGVMSDVVHALRLGASDYIVKPVTDLAVVEHAIDKIMERARLVRENEAYRDRLEEANARLEHTNERLAETVDTLEADLSAGRHVQQAMLPARPFGSNGIQVDYCLVPTLYLSGDFVDYFELRPGVLLHYIVDVSGHGVSSAMVTILLRTEVNRLRTEWRYRISRTIEYPEAVLAHLNRELLRSRIGKHATVFLGMLDTLNQQYVYANAGHFPYPVAEVDGRATDLKHPTFPIGLFQDAAYSVQNFQYDREIAIALGSDGILELDTGSSMALREQHWHETVVASRFDAARIAQSTGMTQNPEVPDDMTVMTVTHWKMP